MFLILCDNLKTLFYCKVYCYSEVFCTAMFFLLSYGQEVCILRCLYNAFSSYTKTANWSCRMSYLIKISNFIFWCFIRFYFGTISHFSFLFPQFIKRLKTSLGVCFFDNLSLKSYSSFYHTVFYALPIAIEWEQVLRVPGIYKKMITQTLWSLKR